MEIAPIPGMRSLPAAKAPKGEYRAPEVFDMEGPAKPGDGAAQGGGRKSASADEEEEQDLVEDAEESEAEAEPRQVDFFA